MSSDSVSGFPSLPPPTYQPTKLVSLLDSRGLVAREEHHKKWFIESQASPCPVPIGMRSIDMEDEGLTMDDDDDEGNDDDSIEEEEEEEDLEVGRDSEEDNGDWLVNQFVEDESVIAMEGDTPSLNDSSLISLGILNPASDQYSSDI